MTVAKQAEQVAPNGKVSEETEAEIRVQFTKRDDGIVEAYFPVSKPFTITLQNMNWGLVREIKKIQGNNSIDSILEFFDKYIVGGAEAVPLDQTMSVFDAITGYMGHAITANSKN